MSGTGSTLVLARWYHLRSLVTAGGRGEAGVLTDVVTMGEVGRHHRGAVTRLRVVEGRLTTAQGLVAIIPTSVINLLRQATLLLSFRCTI